MEIYDEMVLLSLQLLKSERIDEFWFETVETEAESGLLIGNC